MGVPGSGNSQLPESCCFYHHFFSSLGYLLSRTEAAYLLLGIVLEIESCRTVDPHRRNLNSIDLRSNMVHGGAAHGVTMLYETQQ